jgi:hypothetical protein
VPGAMKWLALIQQKLTESRSLDDDPPLGQLVCQKRKLQEGGAWKGFKVKGTISVGWADGKEWCFLGRRSAT